MPNIKINVLCELNEPVDYSILVIGLENKIDPKWKLEFGPIPHILELKNSILNQRKLLLQLLQTMVSFTICRLIY